MCPISEEFRRQAHLLWMKATLEKMVGMNLDPEDFAGGPLTVAMDQPSSQPDADFFQASAEFQAARALQSAMSDESDGPTAIPAIHDPDSDGTCKKCGRSRFEIDQEPYAECLRRVDFSLITRGVVGA